MYDWIVCVLFFFRETLCPALDRPSVIVMDNAPYHNIKADRCWYPRSSSNKIQIINWLTERGVPVNDAMTKVCYSQWFLISQILQRVS